MGEAWFLYDRPGCSAVVALGAFEGRTLSGLMLSEREALLGTSNAALDDAFPLMIKWLDTREALSVQVHPNEEDARRLGVQPKDECWYVLSAEPGSLIHLGLKGGVDASAFAALEGAPDIVDLLQSFEPRAGQFINVPAGTIHSIGAGLTLVEIQQNSETTYRIYDWGRSNSPGESRSLHWDTALQCTDFDAVSTGPVEPKIDDPSQLNGSALLAREQNYNIDYLRISDDLKHSTRGRAWLYLPISGAGTLEVAGGGSTRLEAGETWLLPADVNDYAITDCDGDLAVLRVEVC